MQQAMTFQEGEKVEYLSAKCGGWVNGSIQAVLENGELVIDIRNASQPGKVIKGTVHVKPEKVEEKVKARKPKDGREEPKKEPPKRAQPAQASQLPAEGATLGNAATPAPASSSSAEPPKPSGEQSPSERKAAGHERAPIPTSAFLAERKSTTQRKIQNRKTDRPASQSWADMSRDEWLKEDWPAPSASSISISSSSLRKPPTPVPPVTKTDGDLALRKKAVPAQSTPRSKRSDEMSKAQEFTGPKVSPSQPERRRDRAEKNAERNVDDWMRRRMEEPDKPRSPRDLPPRQRSPRQEEPWKDAETRQLPRQENPWKSPPLSRGPPPAVGPDPSLIEPPRPTEPPPPAPLAPVLTGPQRHERFEKLSPIVPLSSPVAAVREDIWAAPAPAPPPPVPSVISPSAAMLEIWGEGKSTATKNPLPYSLKQRTHPSGFNVYAKEFVPSMYPGPSQYQVSPPQVPPPPPPPPVLDMPTYGSFAPGPPETAYPRYLMPAAMSSPMSSPPDVYRGRSGPSPVARSFSRPLTPEPEFPDLDVPPVHSSSSMPENEEVVIPDVVEMPNVGDAEAPPPRVQLSAALNPVLASEPPRRRARSPELVECGFHGPFLQFSPSDRALRSLSVDAREPKVRTFDLSGCGDDRASVADTDIGDEVLYGPTNAEAPDPSKLLNPNAEEFVPTIPQPPVEDEEGSEYGELSKEMAEGAVRILGDELDLSSTRSSDGMDTM